ncbi:hypothetical protein AVT44_gp08 [Acinetobacter phage Fri1]|uniref:Uncharacterized protein n=1 Tax=Acinetobacter phage Fri1 TaxID=1647373 RepID=A0A0H4TF97_9CAUD|nr:hypothetical protein AVT44_gp08 [Acinetobacter phage Fri1]AKQ06813.1 hypothetical protein Fri1_8 [Acinetobacter phage Fri1]
MSHIIYGVEPIMTVIAQCLEETLLLQQGQYPIHYSAKAYMLGYMGQCGL